jgi:GGDEF domain-containing protein
MNRTYLYCIVMLAVLSSLAGCAAEKIGQKPSFGVNVANEGEAFVCEAVARREKFIDAAADMGVPRGNAEKLYDLSGAEKPDVVTGFAPAPDRIPTVKRAIDRMSAIAGDSAYYVEVDIQNLGGLNQELGHSRADAVYRELAHITEQHIAALKAHTCSFRHGGDEFSFVIVGPGPTLAGIEAALESADQEIRLHIADQGLAEIKHPKHPDDPSKWGAGIIFGVSQIRGGEDVKTVFGAADQVVERRKQE